MLEIGFIMLLIEEDIATLANIHILTLGQNCCITVYLIRYHKI